MIVRLCSVKYKILRRKLFWSSSAVAWNNCIYNENLSQDSQWIWVRFESHSSWLKSDTVTQFYCLSVTKMHAFIIIRNKTLFTDISEIKHSHLKQKCIYLKVMLYKENILVLGKQIIRRLVMLWILFPNITCILF